MPTENRSSNTEMAAQLSPCPHCGQQDAFVEQLDSDASVVICQGRIDEHSACLARGPVGVQQHACEDQPGHDQAVKEWNKRAAAVHQPDPIAWMVGTAFWWTKEEAERDAAETGLPIVGLGPMAAAAPAESQQGEPLALPKRKMHHLDPSFLSESDKGWNACLDEITKLGPLFTHADPAEVERLRERGDVNADRANKAVAEGNTLRAQLAEAHALLRECQPCLEKAGYGTWQIDEMLSASAEPSAPVVQIPEGYCVMPRQLTAENGAKAMLLGEFKLEVTRECPECAELEEPAEGCEICDGEGEYGQRHVIPWDKIKFIYSEAVKGLALKQ